MAFFTRLLADFDSEALVEGNIAHLTGCVKVLEGTPRHTRARVDEGSASYVCSAAWKDEALFVGCSCLKRTDFDPCRHICAALLDADNGGMLTDLPPRGDIEVIVDDEAASSPGHEGMADSAPANHTAKPGTALERPARPPKWLSTLSRIEGEIRSDRARGTYCKPIAGEIVYELRLGERSYEKELQVNTLVRRGDMKGAGALPRPISVQRSQLAGLQDPRDRQILTTLNGSGNESYGWSYRYQNPARDRFELDALIQGQVLPWLCATGRCFLRTSSASTSGPLAFDNGPPWDLRIQVRRENRSLVLEACLVRGGDSLPRTEILALLASGYVITKDKIAPIDLHNALAWTQYYGPKELLRVPEDDEAQLLEFLWRSTNVPPVDWPEDLAFERVEVRPQPCLRLRPGPDEGAPRARLAAEIGFRYGDLSVRVRDLIPHIPDLERRRVFPREKAAEAAALTPLRDLGFRDPPRSVIRSLPPEDVHDLEIPPGRVPGAVRALLKSGWHVEAEGKLYRQPSAFKMSVSSGVDWFDVNGEVDFNGQVVQLPALLKALKRGENTVVLGDGTLGILPEEWLKKYGLVLETGKTEGDSVRFGRSQVGLLDALLAAQPEISVDETFKLARRKLREFDGIKPLPAPGGFRGELRPYQQEGLGWLEFLQRFGFGGCLADDMGLGKTIQVLAMLESRRMQARPKGQKRAPALVIVPRSLVFNWKSEAKRFTPDLRVLDHSGIDRVKALDHLSDYDLVLTTYGTLRRDVPYLRDFLFDFVILDEAQTVKNSESESSKAVRLLSGRHRLALSGTPIENHLGELWSLFEFLNPGMLGGSAVFKLFAGSNGRSLQPEVLPILQSALRPFILRRKKEQVAKDLPEKLEQTLFCELEADEKRRYDELRDHYRARVLGLVDEEGLKKVQFHVLEALLRLRQAACHPGLVDKALRKESSAKLDVLLGQLREAWEEGHKTLVFSQFTQFLGILRMHLDREGIPHEYLDGKTKDRQARVDRFQNDPDCKLVLISLKAGGLGLNLTAAEYVFLLDPWWNPAVEAQAIDRAHRIGQTRRVFAYRIVARGTVEEKVLELQKSKRELADAIINEENNVLRGLTREDLEQLLS